MKRRRLLTVLAALTLGVVGALVPMVTAEAAAACVTPYNNSAVYTSGMTASYNGHNWTAKWWTQGEAPSTGGSNVWRDDGGCDGNSGGGGSTCNYPNWVAQQ
jgi:chitodextrinase